MKIESKGSNKESDFKGLLSAGFQVPAFGTERHRNSVSKQQGKMTHPSRRISVQGCPAPSSLTPCISHDDLHFLWEKRCPPVNKDWPTSIKSHTHLFSQNCTGSLSVKPRAFEHDGVRCGERCSWHQWLPRTREASPALNRSLLMRIGCFLYSCTGSHGHDSGLQRNT